ncbi:hypothetical protein F5Y04DRAFT_293084 [Hypomontagnella monticulosa]|nr:hypothetical protein F5Y04DRAFT_293084 [Hypomontagnella monticulosa]
MATSHTVHIANNSGQDIYVMAALSKEWAVVDFITDIGLMFVGIEEIKAVTMTAELPETLKTFRDLYEFLKIFTKLQLGMVGTATRPAEAVLAAIDAFKKISIRICTDECKAVERNGFFSMYMSANGLASMAGAKNISLTVMTGDMRHVAMWDTGNDDSWIVGKEEIARFIYGTLWQDDEAAGSISWEVQA